MNTSTKKLWLYKTLECIGPGEKKEKKFGQWYGWWLRGFNTLVCPWGRKKRWKWMDIHGNGMNEFLFFKDNNVDPPPGMLLAEGWSWKRPAGIIFKSLGKERDETLTYSHTSISFLSLSHVYILNVNTPPSIKYNPDNNTLTWRNWVRWLPRYSQFTGSLSCWFFRSAQTVWRPHSVVIWQVLRGLLLTPVVCLSGKQKKKCRCYSHTHVSVWAAALDSHTADGGRARDSAILPLYICADADTRILFSFFF